MGQGVSSTLIITNDYRSRQAMIHLWSRAPMRVRMIPEQGRFLAHLKLRRPGFAWCDALMWRPVISRRHVEAVPVKCGILFQSVGHTHAHVGTIYHIQCRAKIGLVDTYGRRELVIKKCRTPAL